MDQEKQTTPSEPAEPLNQEQVQPVDAGVDNSMDNSQEKLSDVSLNPDQSTEPINQEESEPEGSVNEKVAKGNSTNNESPDSNAIHQPPEVDSPVDQQLKPKDNNVSQPVEHPANVDGNLSTTKAVIAAVFVIIIIGALVILAYHKK